MMVLHKKLRIICSDILRSDVRVLREHVNCGMEASPTSIIARALEDVLLDD